MARVGAASRGRWPYVLVAIAGVAAALVQWLVNVRQQIHLVPMATVVVYGSLALLTGAGLVLGLADRLVQMAGERRSLADRLLELPARRSGRLPRICDVTAYQMGVARSRYAGRADPYVPRRVDADLDRALREHPFVLLVGPSNADFRAGISTLIRWRP